MKFRLTPLNIVTALGLGLLGGGFYLLIIGCLVAVTFVSDMIFRFTLKDLKRIWIVELVFIVLTATIILILQK